MAISFIVTTYNVAPYIEGCLRSIAHVARPGDELILVDDGSNDGTLEVIKTSIARKILTEGVRYKPILLGTNTVGGVGIGGNIGLSAAVCDTVFFVDGDDWINPDGFNRARAFWGFHSHDILFTNYLNFDTESGQKSPPADNHLWGTVHSKASDEDIRLQALAFIGVPWRKFYRRAFLETHQLRFPEGNFFFEDNPFHWDVCRNAYDIGFTDRITCFHRTNRRGQTLASTGVELIAFFTHFQTIWEKLPQNASRYKVQACLWLLENMAWHIERLSSQAQPLYAAAGAQALGVVEAAIWSHLRTIYDLDAPVWTVADRLYKGNVDKQIAQWERAVLHKRLQGLETQSISLAAQGTKISQCLLGQSAARSFRTIWEKAKQQSRVEPDPA